MHTRKYWSNLTSLMRSLLGNCGEAAAMEVVKVAASSKAVLLRRPGRLSGGPSLATIAAAALSTSAKLSIA